MTALVNETDVQEHGTCNRGGQTFLSKSVEIGKLIECIEEKLRPAPQPVP
jgi:hypothetical protein